MSKSNKRSGGEIPRFALLLLALLATLVVQAVAPNNVWANVARVLVVLLCWGIAIWWFWAWFKDKTK